MASTGKSLEALAKRVGDKAKLAADMRLSVAGTVSRGLVGVASQETAAVPQGTTATP